MSRFSESRRQFLKATGLAAGALWLSPERSHCHQQLHMDFGFMALFEYV